MRSRGALGCVVGALAALAACDPLPDLDAGVCGNHVIEAGEDCDGFSDSEDAWCRPPDLGDACHYDCSLTTGTTQKPYVCPSGFGCDPEGICRKPTKQFSAGEAIPGAAETLVAADFDGNGRKDVLALERPGALGLRKPSIHYFDPFARTQASWSTSVEIASPTVANVSLDGHDDLVFSVGALVMMQGESNQTLTPLPRASYYLPDSRIHSVAVIEGPLENTTPILLLRQTEEGLAMDRPDDVEQLQRLAVLDGHIDDLIGDPVSADVFEDDEEYPCFDVSFSLRGASSVGVYQGCEREENGTVVWRDDALVTTLRFDPPSLVTGAPMFADLDGDGHLDLLVTAESGPYASFGDGASLGPLEPFTIMLARDPAPTQDPIAAGDFSGDGLADLILPDRVLISVKRESRLEYRQVFDALGKPWSVARVADLNGDGKLDAIAASADHPDIDFLAGTGLGGPNPFVIPTIHPVNRLTVGDFDGDQINDLAFVEPGGGPRESLDMDGPDDQMSVAFGNLVGAPSAPVPLGHLANITEITGLDDHPNDHLSDILVVQDVPPMQPSPASTTPAGPIGPDGPEVSVNSSLSIIFGSGDRTFYAPAVVSNFAADGSLEGADSVSVTTGSFEGTRRLDVAMIGVSDGDPDPIDVEPEFSLWFLADIRSQQTVMRRLPYPFDSAFEPLRARRLTVVMRAKDLDGDGADELIVAGPAGDGSACLVQVAKLDAVGDRFVASDAIRIADGCEEEPLLQIDDFDADGAFDLAISTGSTAAGGHIRVLWNDGRGGLAEAGELPFFSSPDADPIRSFSFFRERDEEPSRLAYVTSSNLFLFQMKKRGRELESLYVDDDGEPAPASALSGGATSIVSGDISGDGITDLVIADDGDVTAFHALLVAR